MIANKNRTRNDKTPTFVRRGKPYLDGVTLLYVSDAMTSEALFRSGGGDILHHGLT